MPTHDHIRLARAAYEAYETGDRQALEDLVADDFAFWSPQDDGIDRATYFDRCWRVDGSRFRNTEILTFDGDQMRKVEVYFGWNL
jgi:hypothetical protein